MEDNNKIHNRPEKQRLCPCCGQPWPDNRDDGEELTRRQKEVIICIARGLSSKGIATQLGISSRTAEYHRNAIQLKLRVHTTAEIIRYAFMHGLG